MPESVDLSALLCTSAVGFCIFSVCMVVIRWPLTSGFASQSACGKACVGEVPLKSTKLSSFRQDNFSIRQKSFESRKFFIMFELNFCQFECFILWIVNADLLLGAWRHTGVLRPVEPVCSPPFILEASIGFGSIYMNTCAKFRKLSNVYRAENLLDFKLYYFILCRRSHRRLPN